MIIRIDSFQLSFNAKDKVGIIRLNFDDGNHINIGKISGSDFTAISLILRNDPVFFDTTEKWISTDVEPVNNIIL